MNPLLSERAVRLLAIDRLARRSQGVTMVEMIFDTCTSRATIKRDIAAARDDGALDIYFDFDAKCWRASGATVYDMILDHARNLS